MGKRQSQAIEAEAGSDADSGAEATQKMPTITMRSATIEVEGFALQVPMAEPEEGTYIASQIGRIDVSLNRFDELPGFRKLHAGLRAANIVMKDGKPVLSAADVVRWLMQQLTMVAP